MGSLIQIEMPTAIGAKRGCSVCPLDKKKGINKILGRVRGKKIFVWAQSPGPKENKESKELIGPSGEFLWYELRQVGIKRKHCDIQNVVRCMPAEINRNDYPALQMRSPTKEEIKCCSIYNEQALEKSNAKLHLVFGQVAAQSLLGKEYKKDNRIFYSDHLKSWVVYLDHPSYFIRQGFRAGDGKTPNAALTRLRDDLAKAKQILKHDKFDQYGFVKSQKYYGITTRRDARKAYEYLKHAGLSGNRLVADMEGGKIKHGKPNEDGEWKALCCGFSVKPGVSYVFALDHPDAPISTRGRKLNRELVKKLLHNSKINKAFHYGISDTTVIKNLLDETVQGYDYDTLLGEYFYDPDAKKYGLDAIADRRYSDFADYKTLEGPESLTPKFLEFLQTKKSYAKMSMHDQVMLGRKKNGLNLARMPWEKIVLYNGADCHLTKLVEQDTKARVSQPLMQVYIDASYVLHSMETEKECLPLFDYHWHKKIDKLFTKREKTLRRRVCKMAGKYAYIPHRKTGELIKKRFNPNSNDHILWLLYTKLDYTFKAEDDNDKPNTRAGSLERLAIKHKKAGVIVEYRQVRKARSTYVHGYYKCAELNDGHLRTNWKTTGTRTGRLSSGKSADKANVAVVNFQNIHGDPLIKCLLISDRRWYKLYQYWLDHGDFTKDTWKKFKDYYVDFGLDFSQNELRQLAEESNDRNLIKMFSSGEDPHVEVGHEITGWSKKSIAEDDRVRKLIKNIQFGLVYGLAGRGLYLFIIAKGVKTTQAEVEKFHAKYFKRFPGVKRLQKYYRDMVEQTGEVINVFGFRRKLDVAGQKARQEEGLEREGAYWGNQAINTPIQGAAHQLLMMAIAALHRKAKKYFLLKYPNKEIHDAMYFKQKLKYLFAACKQGVELMVKEPVEIVKHDFKLKKKVPLSAKPAAGFRFGVKVEGIGSDKCKHEWDFLNQWCRANQALQKDFNKQLAQLES